MPTSAPKGALDKRPFGTQQDIYGDNFEWINHSIAPQRIEDSDFRITVGGPDCRAPYSLSLFNISAMSFGALSANAIRALNGGAKLGGFAHDTGEGGISRYHREFGGDLIWEIGSGYFGCRTADGSFCPDRFAAQAREPQVKMIEIKLSQGAKPGHGGVLPGAKVTRGDRGGARRADRRRLHLARAPFGVRHAGRDDALHRATARLVRRQAGRLQALHRPSLGVHGDLQGHAGNRHPPGLHRHRRFGGRHRRAPLEFVDHVGTPLREGLVLAHNCLVGPDCANRSASARADGW